MRKYILGITLLACGLQFSVAQEAYRYPFQNPALSIDARAADLVSRLTFDEKIGQMVHTSPAIERLGIPAYDWWNECLHGVVSEDYKATVYPQAIGMAAGWDVDAIRQMGDYTAEEGRAIYNISQKKKDYRNFHGLTYWGPNINIFCDPRWGRGQETYGEDPFLTASLGVNFVQGLQGDDPLYLKAAGCAKHYAVHHGPESSRHTYNAVVNDYDLWDTYLPAFKALVNNGVAGVMCAYNAFGGQPCCGSNELMTHILRDVWRFQGYVTSDCGAISDFYKNHKTHPDAASAAVDAVYNGADLECSWENLGISYHSLKSAVAAGRITEAQMDVSLRRLFEIRLRLGMFDPEGTAPYTDIDSTHLEMKEHEGLALKMAQQSIVMLKNNGILPLKKKKLKKVALLGPNINDPEVQLGNYNGFPTRIITPLDAFKAELEAGVQLYSDTVIDHYGDTPASFSGALEQVKDADVIIYVGGLSPRIEGEEKQIKVDGFSDGDRTSVLLPKVQTDLLKALKGTGKPVILVMMAGSAIATPWESEHVDAILTAWYGGQSAGTAIADVLFGRYNPSGHLPLTVYARDSDLPDFEDYSMANRTYRYFKGNALYPFGYGLSYTEFAYKWEVKPRKEYKTGETISAVLNVKNTGKVAGGEVAQVYIRYPQNRNLPLKELRAFKRLSLAKGETGKMKVSIPIEQLAKWDDKAGKLVVPKGHYTIFAGGDSADEVVAETFEID